MKRVKKFEIQKLDKNQKIILFPPFKINFVEFWLNWFWLNCDGYCVCVITIRLAYTLPASIRIKVLITDQRI